MQTHYVAYGLALRSSFRLPGMVPSLPGTVPSDQGGLPPLALELIAPAELATIWSGPGGAHIWQGRLGDGSDLTIDRGVAGDLLFTNGERAWYRLDPSGQSLACMPRCPGLDWQRTLLTKVLSSISVMRGYEALHASAIRSPWGAVAIAAPSGMGKTTLALELMRRGWPMLSDDVLALAATSRGVSAHPGTPHMNVAIGSSEGPSAQEIGPTLAVLAGERWVAAREAASEACPVRAICLLERRTGLSLDIQVLPANSLPLAPYMLGLPGDAARERHRFELYADLMASATLMRLTADPADRPADLADLIERALVDRPTALALGGAR
jgi:hypothetical protein